MTIYSRFVADHLKNTHNRLQKTFKTCKDNQIPNKCTRKIFILKRKIPIFETIDNKDIDIMTNKTLEINYKEFSSLDELEPQDRELCEAAEKALTGSYAPYSNFNVGAAVRLADGTIVLGANQENSAYPSGLCAERTAMFAAHANHPQTPMRSIAITGAQNGKLNRGITAPCGACRQVMAEYQKVAGQNMSVLLYGSDVILKFEKVDDVLPFIFTNLD